MQVHIYIYVANYLKGYDLIPVVKTVFVFMQKCRKYVGVDVLLYLV